MQTSPTSFQHSSLAAQGALRCCLTAQSAAAHTPASILSSRPTTLPELLDESPPAKKKGSLGWRHTHRTWRTRLLFSNGRVMLSYGEQSMHSESSSERSCQLGAPAQLLTMRQLDQKPRPWHVARTSHRAAIRRKRPLFTDVERQT